ncbi:Uncharacterised protein [Bergeyella zoohelcum]|uniref:DinB superfamily n=1 Tax=Bergeyella zoohelcum TaxID=1015 RepID=A0A380ZWW0_9FLAO|nr:Uncharacterised protein [Bergeyella zoohelcum]
MLHYYLSGNDFRIDTYWIDTFRKGTLPTLEVTESDVEKLDFLLVETGKILIEDYDEGLFDDYQSYTTSFGLDLKNIQEAIIFNNIHEGLHYGYVMAQKRALLQYF